MNRKEKVYSKTSMIFNPSIGCTITGGKENLCWKMNYRLFTGQKGIRKLMNLFDSLQHQERCREESFSIKLCSRKCSVCENNLDCLKFESEKMSGDFSICRKCISIAEEWYDDRKEDIIYSEEGLFSIVKTKGENYYGFVDNEHLDSNCRIVFNEFLTVSLSNIKKFQEMLDKRDKDIESELVDNRTCGICHRTKKSLIFNGGQTCICYECTDSIINSLNDYVKNNNKQFISHII